MIGVASLSMILLAVLMFLVFFKTRFIRHCDEAQDQDCEKEECERKRKRIASRRRKRKMAEIF